MKLIHSKLKTQKNIEEEKKVQISKLASEDPVLVHAPNNTDILW